jgi:hypothetical protein
MKIVEWDDGNLPAIIVLPNETVQVLDTAQDDCLEVGDMIYYLSEIGTSVYRVTEVEPEYDPVGRKTDLRRVTIEAV